MTWFDAKIVAVDQVATDIKSFRLVPADPQAGLASWKPGAHLDVRAENGIVRQYSLCGDPADPASYRIAILHEAAGRGGSEYFHSHVVPGSTVAISEPRNLFPLVEGRSNYLLIAGGIGITPILPMIRELDAAGRAWHLHYGGRALDRMAFTDELAAYDDRVDLHTGLLDLPRILSEQPKGTAVYCCGPTALMDAVLETAAAVGLDDVHIERFAPVEAAEDSDGTALDSFDVELRQTGVTLHIEKGQTILDAVIEVLPDHPYSCESGTCGNCVSTVLEGTPVHRDCVLSDDERKSKMMICVGGSASKRLVLDL